MQEVSMAILLLVVASASSFQLNLQLKAKDGKPYNVCLGLGRTPSGEIGVASYPCDTKSLGQQWEVVVGQKIRNKGTLTCLAGYKVGQDVKLKVDTCNDNAPQQKWPKDVNGVYVRNVHSGIALKLDPKHGRQLLSQTAINALIIVGGIVGLATGIGFVEIIGMPFIPILPIAG